MAIMLLRHRLRPFVTLASLILFLVLIQTLYPELGLSSGGSQTSAIDRQEKGYQNIAARRILSLQHETIFSSELGGISLPAASGLNHGLGNVSTRKVISKPCEDVRNHTGFPSACAYVRANTECHSGTLVEYTTLFYCRFAKMHLVGYLLLFIWLVMLFYMLGNTAADYFCYSLKKLSNLLQLPPTVAGVSLLPLGNGAPDVFASIAAFMGSGHSQVGLNSVLGGAVFVTSVVAGSVCLAVQFRSHESSRVHLDSCCFLRDMGFFLFTLGILCAIIVIGEIHFWESVAYLSIYVLYAISVAAFAMKTSGCIKQKRFLLENLLTGMSTFWFIPSPSLFLYQFPLNCGMKSEECLSIKLLALSCWTLCIRTLELPFDLPRRLTIPVADDLRWSRPFAIASAVLAPALLAGVWDSKDGEPFGTSISEYLVGGSIGVVLGIIAFFTTEPEQPPHHSLFIWVAGSFIMSIVWFYLIATELVAALVALGVILEINPAILGLTLLAWGNSIGDLISNLALSLNSGDDVQIAISGCYAGPMFNTLVGLGLSFVLASWKASPNALILREDNSLFLTIGFLFVILLWVLVVLPASDMCPNKIMGVGLLLLYATFLSLQLAKSLGFISLGHVSLGSESGFLGIQIL
ncbi:unnamed protein product [Sphagnum balticum]